MKRCVSSHPRNWCFWSFVMVKTLKGKETMATIGRNSYKFDLVPKSKSTTAKHKKINSLVIHSSIVLLAPTTLSTSDELMLNDLPAAVHKMHFNSIDVKWKELKYESTRCDFVLLWNGIDWKFVTSGWAMETKSESARYKMINGSECFAWANQLIVFFLFTEIAFFNTRGNNYSQQNRCCLMHEHHHRTTHSIQNFLQMNDSTCRFTTLTTFSYVTNYVSPNKIAELIDIASSLEVRTIFFNY